MTTLKNEEGTYLSLLICQMSYSLFDFLSIFFNIKYLLVKIFKEMLDFKKSGNIVVTNDKVCSILDVYTCFIVKCELNI